MTSNRRQALPPIASDPLYQLCLRVASRCKAGLKFGAVLVKDGQVIGQGWNRLLEPTDSIRMGYANHAEVNALNDALGRRVDPTGAVLYVAGYFADGSVYIADRERFSCALCPRHLLARGVAQVRVPSPQGWRTMTPQRALDLGRQFVAEGASRDVVGKRRWRAEEILASRQPEAGLEIQAV